MTKRIPKRYRPFVASKQPGQQPDSSLKGLKFEWNARLWTVIDHDNTTARIQCGTIRSQIALAMLPRVAKVSAA
jgi:hypothetical protein